MKKKQTVLLGIAFVVLVVGMIVYSTMGQGRYRCEVCMEYLGRRSCRIAAASTQPQALRAAIENACALIASGVTESTGCQSTPPASVKWLN